MFVRIHTFAFDAHLLNRPDSFGGGRIRGSRPPEQESAPIITSMRLPQIITSLLVVLGATSAYAQSRPAVPSRCDLPHASGVSSQQLTSGQRPRTYRLFVPSGYDGHQRLPLVL